jgi:hypothetical protein
MAAAGDPATALPQSCAAAACDPVHSVGSRTPQRSSVACVAVL